MYQIRYTKTAEKYFKKIKEKGLREAYHRAIVILEGNPYAGQSKVGDLSGVYSYDVFYSRTNYEIAYRIYEEGEKVVVVILAGTRENFYKELKRYM